MKQMAGIEKALFTPSNQSNGNASYKKRPHRSVNPRKRAFVGFLFCRDGQGIDDTNPPSNSGGGT